MTDVVPVTRITMDDGREYKTRGNPQVVGLLLKNAKQGGWNFEGRDPQGRIFAIPAKEIGNGKCRADGTTRR